MDPPLIREIEIKIEKCQQKNIYVYKCREREHVRMRETERGKGREVDCIWEVHF